VLWISSEWSYKLFFFFASTTNTWKNILQCSVAGLKIGNSSFLPRLWLLWRVWAGKIFKGDLKSLCYPLFPPLHEAGQCWCHPCACGYYRREVHGLVFQKNVRHRRGITWFCWELCSHRWPVFPLPVSMVSALVGAADRCDVITESNYGS